MGYIIGMRSNSNISGDKTENSRGSYDYWLVKTNSAGTIQWDKTIGGASPLGFEDDRIYFVKESHNNDGFLVCGSSSSPLSGDKTSNPVGAADFWIVKTNPLGGIVWQATIGGTDDDVPTTAISTTDGGYLIGGYSSSNIFGNKTENCRGLQDYWIVKINSSGVVEWDKTYGGSSNDILRSIITTSDGGYLLGGRSNSNISGEKTENSKGSGDYWILKINPLGVIQWQKTLGGSGFEEFADVVELPNGQFFISGHSNSSISGDKTQVSRGLDDFWCLKLSATGTLVWQKTIGGDGYDYLHSSALCSDGGVILASSSSSSISGEKTEAINGIIDGWVVKLNNLGEIAWQKTLGGSDQDGLNTIVQTADGGYHVSGITQSPISGDISIAPKGVYDCWVVKFAPDNLSVLENNKLQDFIYYPNPTYDILNIEFGVFQEEAVISLRNILGQEIYSTTLHQINNAKINIVDEAGIYFLTINNNQSVKIIKE